MNSDTAAENAVRALLKYVGENPDRAGLMETPARVVKALKEMTEGYSQNPSEILLKSFPTDDTESGVVYDGMVVQKNIPLVSSCEHHWMPFSGVAHVAYIPGKKVAGLSKLARLVDCYAKRLQIQERLTTEIADALVKHLKCKAAACVIEATHTCMCYRGVRKHGTTTRTATLRGLFMSNASVRSELMFHLAQ